MKLGIIGLPEAGKSTLFEALTKIIMDEATHKPEDRLGTIRVPDDRVDRLSAMFTPKKTIYAQVEYLLPWCWNGRKQNSIVRGCFLILRTTGNLIQLF